MINYILIIINDTIVAMQVRLLFSNFRNKSVTLSYVMNLRKQPVEKHFPKII